MHIVFFGTPDFTLPILNALHKEYKTPDGLPPIEAVVTQPPRPAGRKKQLKYSAVDTWAHKRNEHIRYDNDKIKILHKPEDLLKENLESKIAVLAAFGAILPKEIIELFPHGILNIHPSKLPEFRGASPIQAAIATGKSETGITIMKMDEKLDHGPIITQSTEDILPNDTNESLTQRLFEKSAEMLVEMLPAYISGKIKLKPQDDDKATFTTLIKKEHGFVPWEEIETAMTNTSSRHSEGAKATEESHPKAKDSSATPLNDKNWKIPFIKDYSQDYSPQNIHNYIRALHPWPGVWTVITKKNGEEKRMKIISSEVEDEKLVLKHVQLEGKDIASWSELRF